MMACSQKVRPILDFTTALYIPNSEVKYDINFGLIRKRKITYIASLGLGNGKPLSSNVKGMLVFNNWKMGKVFPFLLSQFKYNNRRIYNELVLNPAFIYLDFRNSIIFQFGIMAPISRNGLNVSIQSGVSYNFTKIIEDRYIIYPKLYNDTKFNFINSFSIIKSF